MPKNDFPDERARDLAIVCKIPISKLEQLNDELQSLVPPVISHQALFEKISAIVADETVADALLRQLIALSNAMRRSEISSDDMIQMVARLGQNAFDWDTNDLSDWMSVSAAFVRLLSTPSLLLVSKAIDLSYEYTNLLRRARIITDVRPIFAANAESIEGAVVSYTLRVAYESSGNQTEISLALDVSDIEDLLEQCERSLKKASVAKSFFSQIHEFPITISGEE